MATTDVWNFRDEALAGINLTGFELRARDGVVGRVVQSIEGSGGGYLVVDPGVVMPLGRHLLVPVGLVERIEVDGQRVIVHGDRERIKNAPEYDRMRPLDDRARNVFGNYFRSFMPEVSGRAGERAPAKSRPSTRRSRPSSGRGTRPARSAARSRSRSTASDEPTKEQLYEQARKLGIEGRSKMNKAQLARVVGRRSGQPASSGRSSSKAKANPVEVQAFLEGVGYPTRTGQLVRDAESQQANREVRETLKRLPEKEFKSPTEVSEAIGKLS